MNLDVVMKWMNVANMALPEAKALFDNLLTLFGETDQQKLKDELAEIQKRNDDSHAARQQRFKNAQDGN